jgi:single-strand DNA-binding protein
VKKPENEFQKARGKNMNKVIISGRVVRDVDVRYSQTVNGSVAVARYTLAVDRRRARNNNDEQSADFISCIAFGKNGEFAEKYLHQGTKIIVEGRWQTGNYTNKDGQKVYTNDCVVERHEFCESRTNQQSGNNGIMGGNSSNDGFMAIPDDVADEGLPFN